MKHLLTLAALASVAVTSSLATPSDACGYYGPRLRVFRIAVHATDHDGPRAFVLTAPNATMEGHTFTRLDEMSYDATQVAEVAKLDAPWEVTLVGRSDVARVTGSKSVIVAQDYMNAQGRPMFGIEIPAPNEQFAIGVAGKHRDMSWKPATEDRSLTAADWKFLRDNKIETGIAKTRVPFTRHTFASVGYTAFTKYNADTNTYETSVRNKSGEFMGTQAGWPFGVLGIDGETHLVFDSFGVESVMQVY